MPIRKSTTKAPSWLSCRDLLHPAECSAEQICILMNAYTYITPQPCFHRTQPKNNNLSALQWGWVTLLSLDIYPALLKAMNNSSASKIWLMKSTTDFPFYFRMNISCGCYLCIEYIKIERPLNEWEIPLFETILCIKYNCTGSSGSSLINLLLAEIL